MKLSDRVENGIVIMEPKGKIMGGPDATLLHDKLHEYLENEHLQIVIDLSKVEWMNSTGLGILISGYTSLKNHKGALKLANVTDKIQSLLTITKLITIFDTYDSVEDAIESFSN